MVNVTKTYTQSSLLAEVIPQAVKWSYQAGRMAMHHFKNSTVTYKTDHTFVTPADVEIDRFLGEQIRRAYPDHGLISEEGLQLQPSDNTPYTWVIDPLDGTTAFVRGLPGWGISIALLEQTRPIFGLFYLPLLDDLTYATPHKLCYNGQILQQTVQLDWQHRGFMAVSAGSHQDFCIAIPRTRTLGSVGANLIYTARGAATTAFIPKAYLWDLVAGALILNRAGGELRYLSGRPVDYRALLGRTLISEPIIAGHPDLLNQLQGAIRPRNLDNVVMR